MEKREEQAATAIQTIIRSSKFNDKQHIYTESLYTTK